MTLSDQSDSSIHLHCGIKKLYYVRPCIGGSTAVMSTSEFSPSSVISPSTYETISNPCCPSLSTVLFFYAQPYIALSTILSQYCVKKIKHYSQYYDFRDFILEILHFSPHNIIDAFLFSICYAFILEILYFEFLQQ